MVGIHLLEPTMLVEEIVPLFCMINLPDKDAVQIHLSPFVLALMEALSAHQYM